MIDVKINKRCLNLCGFPFVRLAEELEKGGFDEYYIGSYTCGVYFLELLQRLTIVSGLKIRLVIPVLSEGQFIRAHEILAGISVLTENNIAFFSGIVANDFAGIELRTFFPKAPLFLGRIFFREYRDFRYSEYIMQPAVTKIPELIKIINSMSEICGVELDICAQKISVNDIPAGLEIGVHYPDILMTYGHICEYASVHKPLEKKFRPDCECCFECFGSVIKWNVDGLEYMQRDRGIYSSADRNVTISGGAVSVLIPWWRRKDENSCTAD